VLSVLIVVNVVSGAVVAGTQRIGVLKSIGFSPFQVVMTYVLQVALPALLGCALGAVLGNPLSAPVLNRSAQVYGAGSLSVPLWVDVVVPLVLLALTCVAGLLPALRSGRMSAVQAIATGRAPRPARGFLAHRLLGRMRRLPRPLALGLATPFARPARTLVTLVAVLFGAVAVTFGVGLSTSVSRTANAQSLAPTVPLQVRLAGNPIGPHHGQFSVHGRPVALSGEGATPAQQRTLTTLLNAQPGTRRYVEETDDRISVAGLAAPLVVYSYRGDSSWVGFGVISGRWYSGVGEADVNSYFLTATGAKVGGTYTLSSAGRQQTVRIVGEIFLPGSTTDMIMSSDTLARIAPGLSPQQYDVGVRPGTNVQSYANALSAALASSSLHDTAGVTLANPNSPIFVGVLALVYLLSAILMVVAALGVLNTVVLQVRERVHDLGIYKAIGMSPFQMIAMVVCSVTGIGLAAGVIAVPAGVALHQFIVPIMGHAAQSNLPPSILSVYQPWELVLLGLSGVLIAVAGALAPGSWVARSRTITALRTE
jgi:putative ABC transport system permease protein